MNVHVCTPPHTQSAFIESVSFCPILTSALFFLPTIEQSLCWGLEVRAERPSWAKTHILPFPRQPMAMWSALRSPSEFLASFIHQFGMVKASSSFSLLTFPASTLGVYRILVMGHNVSSSAYICCERP